MKSQAGGYEVSVPVPASTVNMVGGTFWMKDASGASVDPDKDADGTWEYKLHVADVSGAAEFSFGYTVSMGGHQVSNTHNMIMRFFDCAAINGALAAAKDINGRRHRRLQGRGRCPCRRPGCGEKPPPPPKPTSTLRQLR